MSGKPCIFFDRDGVVNRSPGPGYVERVEDFELLPGFVEALRVVTAKGYNAVIITNQRGIARGCMSQETVDAIHELLRSQLAAEGLSLLDIFVCPHENNVCDCRKPQPGMLLQAAKIHGLDLERSWMIGDSETDAEAGKRAGCQTVLVGNADVASLADERVHDMDSLATWLEAKLDEIRPV